MKYLSSLENYGTIVFILLMINCSYDFSLEDLKLCLFSATTLAWNQKFKKKMLMCKYKTIMKK